MERLGGGLRLNSAETDASDRDHEEPLVPIFLRSHNRAGAVSMHEHGSR